MLSLRNSHTLLLQRNKGERAETKEERKRRNSRQTSYMEIRLTYIEQMYILYVVFLIYHC